jgi:hypothetical protein
MKRFRDRVEKRMSRQFGWTEQNIWTEEYRVEWFDAEGRRHTKTTEDWTVVRNAFYKADDANGSPKVTKRTIVSRVEIEDVSDALLRD